jgi:hypothetical protein
LHSCQTKKNAYVCENSTTRISPTASNKLKNQSSFSYINEPRGINEENQFATNYKQYLYHVPVAEFLHVDYRFRAYVEDDEDNSSIQMKTFNVDTDINQSNYICSLNESSAKQAHEPIQTITSAAQNQKPYRDYVFRFYRIC